MVAAKTNPWLDYNMTGFIVALRQTLVAQGLNLFQCITCGGHFVPGVLLESALSLGRPRQKRDAIIKSI